MEHIRTILTRAETLREGGDPDSDIYQPAEADTTLQNEDEWFYNGTVGIRSLGALLDVYHGTVGRNAFLMMDFAPTPDGVIAPDQVYVVCHFSKLSQLDENCRVPNICIISTI